jgi:predicted GIY-YIG superfamily endonuclease
MKNKPHYIYIIHFHEKYKGTQHYTGISYDPKKRFENHKKGRGNGLVKAVHDAGILMTQEILMEFPDYTTAKTAEFNMKKWQTNKRWCPICDGQKQNEHLEYRYGAYYD